MKKLDLCENPLSEEGACSLFRTILGGLQCFVLMRDCTLSPDPTLFNYTFPANASPYILDVSKPYDGAILNELCNIASKQRGCRFENTTYAEGQRVRDGISIQYLTTAKRFVLKGQTEASMWPLPQQGCLCTEFVQTVTMPSPDESMTPKALEIVKAIIIYARSAYDRKKWLRLLCHDLYCTTEQAQNMIDTFIAKRVIGGGGLTKVDIVCRYVF